MAEQKVARMKPPIRRAGREAALRDKRTVMLVRRLNGRAA